MEKTHLKRKQSCSTETSACVERKIKHFSSVQNQQLYFPDLQKYKNKVMMIVEVPMFWHLDEANCELTRDELKYEERKRQNVVFLKL